MHKDILGLASWAKEQGFSLTLSLDRISFLMAITFLHEHQLDGVFEEPELVEAFLAVEESLHGKVEGGRQKANQAINDLVAQRLLLRFSGPWVESGAIYRLSPLGLTLADHYLSDRQFSSLSLSLQLEQVARDMEHATEAARSGGDEEHWQNKVFIPLRYSVADLFDRIDQNQRNFDLQQESTKQKIAVLMHQRWTEAIQLCQKLLSETSETLKQLKGTLEAVGHQLQTALLNLQKEVKEKPERALLSELIQDLQRKLDRILGWGERMIELWAKYDRHVHKFLRTILALDQSRHFQGLLRDSIRHYPEAPWLLCITEAERCSEYDPTHTPEAPPPVIGDLSEAQIDFIAQGNETSLSETIGDWYQQWQQLHPEEKRSVVKTLRAYLTTFPSCAEAIRLQHASTLIQHCLQGNDALQASQGLPPTWEAADPQSLWVQAYELDG